MTLDFPPMTLHFYADPGHGWLRVKRQLLIDYGIEARVTRYSYEKHDYVYLEQDSDATLLLEVLKKAGITPTIIHHNTNGVSSIRTYNAYNPTTPPPPQDRYYLKADWQKEWTEVTREQWIRAERAAGFRPKMLSSDPRYNDTCATAGFSGGGTSGKIHFGSNQG